MRNAIKERIQHLIGYKMRLHDSIYEGMHSEDKEKIKEYFELIKLVDEDLKRLFARLL